MKKYGFDIESTEWLNTDWPNGFPLQIFRVHVGIGEDEETRQFDIDDETLEIAMDDLGFIPEDRPGWMTLEYIADFLNENDIREIIKRFL